MANDHFIQAAYTKNFSTNNTLKRKSPVFIINNKSEIFPNQIAENFSKSNGILLNSFDNEQSNNINQNPYGFYWQDKESFLKDFISKDINKQLEIKEYISLLWSRNVFAYDDAIKQFEEYKKTNKCNLPSNIQLNLNLVSEINKYPSNSIELCNKIFMERFIYFSNVIKSYQVGYFKTNTEFLFLGENPVFHISILNDNDFLWLENLFINKSERNLFNNFIFVPISWNEFYYLYNDINLLPNIDSMLNEIIENNIYNTYAIWKSSKQTLVNNVLASNLGINIENKHKEIRKNTKYQLKKNKV